MRYFPLTLVIFISRRRWRSEDQCARRLYLGEPWVGIAACFYIISHWLIHFTLGVLSGNLNMIVSFEDTFRPPRFWFKFVFSIGVMTPLHGTSRVSRLFYVLHFHLVFNSPLWTVLHIGLTLPYLPHELCTAIAPITCFVWNLFRQQWTETSIDSID